MPGLCFRKISHFARLFPAKSPTLSRKVPHFCQNICMNKWVFNIKNRVFLYECKLLGCCFVLEYLSFHLRGSRCSGRAVTLDTHYPGDVISRDLCAAYAKVFGRLKGRGERRPITSGNFMLQWITIREGASTRAREDAHVIVAVNRFRSDGNRAQ